MPAREGPWNIKPAKCHCAMRVSRTTLAAHQRSCLSQTSIRCGRRMRSTARTLPAVAAAG